MKEWIKKIWNVLNSWSLAAIVNFALAVVHLSLAITSPHAAYLCGILFHITIGVVCMLLMFEQKMRRKAEWYVIIIHDRWVEAHNRVVIYKRHFGDLTPEMEEELRQGTEAAIEEAVKEIEEDD